ncbi:MAG: CBS domain-containing protein [Candidatus Bathyarchaeia archaeon]
MGLKDSVESVMRSPPVTVLFSDSVSIAIEKMISNNIGAIIVISGGNPVGIITERDIIEKVTRVGRDPNKIRAEEVMSSPLISIEADKTIRDALILMRDRKIRRLGVTRRGRLIGIVTERRLLDALASH